MRCVNFFIGRKNKYLSIKLAEKVAGNVLSVFCINSCKWSIDYKRNLMTAESNE